MTTHAAAPGTTAANPFEPMESVLDEASATATEGREWRDPVPAEQVEFLADNQLRGRWTIAPILDPASLRIRVTEETFWVTDDGLARLRNGDPAFANSCARGGSPVHSVGSVSVLSTHAGESWEDLGAREVTYVITSFSAPEQKSTSYDEAATIAKNLAARSPSAGVTIRPTLGDSAMACIRSTLHQVRVELALADYDQSAPIIGYEVVEGTIDLRA